MKYVIEEDEEGNYYVATGLESELYMNIIRDAALNPKMVRSAGHFILNEDKSVRVWGKADAIGMEPKANDVLVIQEAIRLGRVI